MVTSLPATPHCPPPPSAACQYGQFIHSRCGLQCLKVWLLDLKYTTRSDVVTKLYSGPGTCLRGSRGSLWHLWGGTLLFRLQQVTTLSRTNDCWWFHQVCLQWWNLSQVHRMLFLKLPMLRRSRLPLSSWLVALTTFLDQRILNQRQYYPSHQLYKWPIKQEYLLTSVYKVLLVTCFITWSGNTIYFAATWLTFDSWSYKLEETVLYSLSFWPKTD